MSERKEFHIWFESGQCCGLNMSGFLTEREWGIIREIANIYFPPEPEIRNPILFRRYGPISQGPQVRLHRKGERPAQIKYDPNKDW